MDYTSPYSTAPEGNRESQEYKDAVFIFKHLIVSYNLFDKGMKYLNEMDTFGDYPELKCVIDYMVDYASRFQRHPSLQAFKLDIPTELTNVGVSPGIQKVCMKYIEHACSLTKATCDVGMVEYMIEESYKEHMKIVFQNKIATEGVSKEETQAMARLLDKKLFDEAEPTHVFADMDGNLENVIRNALGVDFVDDMLDGGMADGEALCVIAPSGGGKSTLANQVLKAAIDRRRDGWYYSTEQKLKGDMAVRHLCLASGATRNTFSKGMSGVPQPVKDILEKSKPKWIEHCKFMDVSDKEYSSLENLFEPITDSIREGKKPGIIIIDWWGRLLAMLMKSANLKSEKLMRDFEAASLHSIKKFAERFECPIVVLHQLSGAAKGKGPGARLTASDAQGNKSLDNMFDFVIILGQRDGDDNLDAFTDKARSVAKTRVKIHLDGAKCCFHYAEDSDSIEDELLRGSANNHVEVAEGVTYGGQTTSDFKVSDL